MIAYNHKKPADVRLIAGCIGMFGLGACTAVEINLMGRLFLNEILLLLMLPYLLARERPHPATERYHRATMIFGALWLWNQAVTDLIRETPFVDWSRGLSKIAFLLLNYVALRRLLNSDRRILLFGLGLALGSAITSQSQGYDTELAWKFGFGSMYAVILVVLSGTRPFRKFGWLPVALLIGLAAESAVLGTRNLAGVAMLAAGVLVLGKLLDAFHAQTPIGRAAGFLAVGVVGMAAYSGIGYLSSSGMLGERMQKKYQDQIVVGKGSQLLGGRSESRISLTAIRDSPIIGHGSWAKDARYRAQYEAMIAADSGKPLQSRMGPEATLIPSHSYFTSAWIEAGILGAAFWVFVISIVLGSITRLLGWSYPLGPLAAFIACQLLWDIPFSPFGATARLIVAFALVLLPVAACNAEGLAQRQRTGGSKVPVIR